MGKFDLTRYPHKYFDNKIFFLMNKHRKCSHNYLIYKNPCHDLSNVVYINKGEEI